MIKKSVLFFLCFMLFLSMPGCKKKLPTTPDIPTKILPTIEYFTATPESINLDESSTLSWSVSNATTITIDQGIGTVSAKGTTEVSPEDTTIYTLTAKNNDGQKSQSCTVGIALNPPTIEYFTASPTAIILDDYSTLSWSTTNATTITCSNIFGSLPATGTMEVRPSETTTYTLTANNSDGQTTSSCTVEIKKWAELEVSTIPESPMFYYDSDLLITYSDFTVVLIETAGVGGQINDFLIVTGNPLYSETFPGGTFSPFGSFSRDCSWIIPGQPIFLIISIEGVDNNGYMIELDYQFTITWTQSTGTMRFLKTVEGASHHKLIK